MKLFELPSNLKDRYTNVSIQDCLINNLESIFKEYYDKQQLVETFRNSIAALADYQFYNTGNEDISDEEYIISNVVFFEKIGLEEIFTEKITIEAIYDPSMSYPSYTPKEPISSSKLSTSVINYSIRYLENLSTTLKKLDKKITSTGLNIKKYKQDPHKQEQYLKEMDTLVKQRSVLADKVKDPQLKKFLDLRNKKDSPLPTQKIKKIYSEVTRGLARTSKNIEKSKWLEYSITIDQRKLEHVTKTVGNLRDQVQKDLKNSKQGLSQIDKNIRKYRNIRRASIAAAAGGLGILGGMMLYNHYKQKKKDQNKQTPGNPDYNEINNFDIQQLSIVGNTIKEIISNPEITSEELSDILQKVDGLEFSDRKITVEDNTLLIHYNEEFNPKAVLEENTLEDIVDDISNSDNNIFFGLESNDPVVTYESLYLVADLADIFNDVAKNIAIRNL